MTCDHLVYNQYNELESNFVYRESVSKPFIEYHVYECNYCGSQRIEPENFLITLIGFLPRLTLFFLSLPFKLLKKLNINKSKNDF